ncbi:DUF2252 family protein [Pedobacter aquatilis]|uniref:DUF2252 family protein n=1 Tax=Pedobacter aquatilis TaxID=351343 RepID=UPI00292ED473|nr:DUF2252 family protein [Pedobacter aquatilis]
MKEVTKKIFEYNSARKKAVVHLKYKAMCENAYRFFRGSCHLFYQQVSAKSNIFSSPVGWICGDLHLENFGSFRGNNQMTYFDLNDFDEAVKAPILWEVARLVTSILIAFQVMEIDADQGMNLAILFIRQYRSTLRSGKPQAIDPRTSKGIVKDFLKKASRSSAKSLLKKRTILHKKQLYLDLRDERHFKIGPKLYADLQQHIRAFLKHSDHTPYNYQVRDVVYRLAGTGSLGQRRYLFLLAHKHRKDDHLLLDMKEALPSSLVPFLTHKQWEWGNEAMRITSIQNRMQQVPSAMLDVTWFRARAYVIQELQPVKDTIKFKLIKDNYRDLIQVINDMAVLTASAHLRSGGTYGSATIDELMHFAKKCDWEPGLLDFAQQACLANFKDYYDFKSDIIG